MKKSLPFNFRIISLRKKFLPLTVLGCFLLLNIYPTFINIADAQVVTGAVKTFSCTVGGMLAPDLAKKLNKGMSQLKDKVLKLLGKKAVLKSRNISFIWGLSEPVPVKDEALIDTYNAKEAFGDILSRCFAREVLNKTIGGMLSIARTGGRDGGPAYVRNWRKFQLESGYRGEGIFKGMLDSTQTCDYFGNDLKNLFGAKNATSPKGAQTRTDFDSFALKMNCTLPSNFSMTNYKQDFSGNGGWEAWSRLLEPQNNFYGAFFQSLDEANRQRAIEEEADKNEALAGRGFLSTRGKNAADSCSIRGRDGKCLIYKDVKTPGSTIADSVASTLQSELDWITNVDELSELITAATELVFNRVLDLSNPDEGEYTFYEEVEPTSNLPPGADCNSVDPSEGATVRYWYDTQNAVDQFIRNNPGIANSPITNQGEVDRYLEGVAMILLPKGYESGRVLNCNGNISKGSIYVGKPGDLYGDYYDMVKGQESGSGATIGQSAQALFIEWAGSERLIPLQTSGGSGGDIGPGGSGGGGGGGASGGGGGGGPAY